MKYTVCSLKRNEIGGNRFDSSDKIGVKMFIVQSIKIYLFYEVYKSKAQILD